MRVSCAVCCCIYHFVNEAKPQLSWLVASSHSGTVCHNGISSGSYLHSSAVPVIPPMLLTHLSFKMCDRSIQSSHCHMIRPHLGFCLWSNAWLDSGKDECRVTILFQNFLQVCLAWGCASNSWCGAQFTVQLSDPVTVSIISSWYHNFFTFMHDIWIYLQKCPLMSTFKFRFALILWVCLAQLYKMLLSYSQLGIRPQEKDGLNSL
jgi:hypothetical protein